MAVKVLIVDDDGKLQGLLREFLEGYGIEVSSLFDGKDIMNNLETIKPDAVVLDVMLPGKDGLELLRQIRKLSAVPVIMLTARGEETDRIVGLELGADDYLPKPFNPRELLARIRAVMRRHTPDTDVRGGLLRSGDLVLDKTRLVLCKGDQEVELSITECRLIEAFMENSGRVVTRDFLLEFSRERSHSAFDRSVDVHVSRLRGKLESILESRERIKSVWGAGYMWVEKE